jgi:hypothetical protein
MHLSYPLRPDVEILNNSVGSSKTFSKSVPQSGWTTMGGVL